MIKSMDDLMSIVDRYYGYLYSHAFDFDERGFPIFRKNMFLHKEPDLLIPYSQRKSRIVQNPKKTVLCFYCSDQLIYPRLENLKTDIPELKKYMGIVMPDLTVTADMDSEWQDILMLLNQLYMAAVVVNGIPVVLNTRCPDRSLLVNFSSFPKNIICASGFLGCAYTKEYDLNYLEKILFLRPSKLLLYGKHDLVAERQLNSMGIHYRVYDDFHRLSRKVA